MADVSWEGPRGCPQLRAHVVSVTAAGKQLHTLEANSVAVLQ